MEILTPDMLAAFSGVLIGLTLGLIGGGGSILAVPLLVYVVGIGSTHLAIGTSAFAVAVNAAFGLAMHAKAHTVKWPCASVFAGAGIAGAALGAWVGKMVNGEMLLALFGLLMIGIGVSMFLRKSDGGNPDVHLDRASAPRMLPPLAGAGLGVGALSGFFGIGGGFLIVPGLITVTAMPILNAVGSSLVSVTVFGLTTSTSYALSGLVDWRIAVFLIGGGAVGAFLGQRLAKRLSGEKQLLSKIFAVFVIVVGLYVTTQGITTLL